MVERIEASLAAVGLPPLAWYDVLWSLEEQGGRLRLAELADYVLLTRSNVTRLVDRLEDAGYVRREAAAEDKRGAYAVLTASGRRLRGKMWEVYRSQIENHFAAHLEDAETALLSKALARVERALRGQ
jgi:DNA-binding MarR family transcriptional regulator